MKVAVITDIHGNWFAMQTVIAHVEAWQPDYIVVGGDVVNRGPRSGDCWAFIQQKAMAPHWYLVRGNHEDYVIGQAHISPQDPRYPIFQIARWAYNQLDGQTGPLEAMPFQVSLRAPDNSELRVVHASMEGNRSGIYSDMTAAELRHKIEPPPRVLCVGHTHRPLIRHVDETMVVNVGSVGLPFDGDRRAAYGQLEWQGGRWHAKIVRLPYNYEAARRDFYETGYATFEGGGPVVELILEELHHARSCLAYWADAYEQQILAGEISVAESVAKFLANLPEIK